MVVGWMTAWAAGRTGALGALFCAHLGTVMYPNSLVHSTPLWVGLAGLFALASAFDYVLLRLDFGDPRMEQSVAVLEPVSVAFGLSSVGGFSPETLLLGLCLALFGGALRGALVPLLWCGAASIFLLAPAALTAGSVGWLLLATSTGGAIGWLLSARAMGRPVKLSALRRSPGWG